MNNKGDVSDNGSGWQRLPSRLDNSVNFVRRVDENGGGSGSGGVLECRVVRRPSSNDATFYLSSSTACAEGCRFCWLTASGQNRGREATMAELAEQIKVLLQECEAWPHLLGGAIGVNVAFMVRGEPLSSGTLLRGWAGFSRWCSCAIEKLGLLVRFKISSIFPRLAHGSLLPFAMGVVPDLYWSLYKIDPLWRRRWMPSVGSVDDTMHELRWWQNQTHKVVRVHHALIAGENDSEADAVAVAAAVAPLRVDYNLVQYNTPDSGRWGTASTAEAMRAYATVLQRESPPNTRIAVLDRVGHDVGASCGMFVSEGLQLLRPEELVRHRGGAVRVHHVAMSSPSPLPSPSPLLSLSVLPPEITINCGDAVEVSDEDRAKLGRALAQYVNEALISINNSSAAES